jgi:hypothetical protein
LSVDVGSSEYVLTVIVVWQVFVSRWDLQNESKYSLGLRIFNKQVRSAAVVFCGVLGGFFFCGFLSGFPVVLCGYLWFSIFSLVLQCCGVI